MKVKTRGWNLMHILLEYLRIKYVSKFKIVKPSKNFACIVKMVLAIK